MNGQDEGRNVNLSREQRESLWLAALQAHSPKAYDHAVRLRAGRIPAARVRAQVAVPRSKVLSIIGIALAAGALLLAEASLTWQQRTQLREAVRTLDVGQVR